MVDALRERDICARNADVAIRVLDIVEGYVTSYQLDGQEMGGDEVDVVRSANGSLPDGVETA